MQILVLNAGSSSLKSELFYSDEQTVHDRALWSAQADWQELPGSAKIRITDARDRKVERDVSVDSLEAAIEHLLASLISGETPAIRSLSEIAVVGHRVVHGGERFRASTVVTSDVRRGIEELAPLAPLHNPMALAGINAVSRILGSRPEQIAVFDTAFHATLPPASYLYPISREYGDRGVRRYGFHGISHQYVSRRAAQLLQRDLSSLRLITCHLGNGCSLCAIREGRSVETTMGFTPLEGLMMGTRSGTVDPGLLIYLLKHERKTPDELDHLLNHASGLKGLSGISSDMRQVLEAAACGSEPARQALDVYVYRLAYFISAMLPSLGRLDGLVFAGGVGENAWQVRERVCHRLEMIGVTIDDELNRLPADDRILSAAGGSVPVLTVRTRENYEIAGECRRVLEHSN